MNPPSTKIIKKKYLSKIILVEICTI
jgi:hypothetical protein